VKRLYAQYARKRAREPHHLGKPKRLLTEEALLLVALERNRYQVEAECPNHNRWHGDASCPDHRRESVIITMAVSRLELLWSLWASVSDQPEETVTLTEQHLRGGVVRRDLGLHSCIDARVAGALAKLTRPGDPLLRLHRFILLIAITAFSLAVAIFTKIVWQSFASGQFSLAVLSAAIGALMVWGVAFSVRTLLWDLGRLALK